VESTGHGAEAGRVGRENQSRCVGWAQSVNVEDAAVVALSIHIRFLIESYIYIYIVASR
jgi:hypothetical protein